MSTSTTHYEGYWIKEPIWKILETFLIEKGYSQSVAHRAAVEEMSVLCERAEHRAEAIVASETK
jgi:hypothetical protein